MKKLLMCFSLILGVFLLTSCSLGGDKVLKCTYNIEDTEEGYELKSTYNVYYNGEVVNKIHSVETITSDDQEVLNYFNTYLNNLYSTMNDTYGGYTYSVNQTSSKLTVDTTIDYKKIDLDKLLEDQPTMKDAANDKNQLTKDGVVDLYDAMDITCEK
jgi:uncharacterized lipoprotein YehR (DUF1307 family)